MIEAKNLGLTKSIGVSNFNEKQMNRLLDHGLEKPTALQIEVVFSCSYLLEGRFRRRSVATPIYPVGVVRAD